MPTTAPPSGTLALLFTDLEGSTQLSQRLGDRWASVLRRHRELSRAVWQLHDGYEVDTAGDGFFVVFADGRRAAAAALAAQRALTTAAWPDGVVVRVRMGLHLGQVTNYDDSYVGYEVHRAARITSAAHGGQVVASAALIDLGLPEGSGISVVDLGHHRLKDLVEPEHLFQLTAPGLPAAFPPLRSARADTAAAKLPATYRSEVSVAPGTLQLPDGRLVAVTTYGLRIGRSPDNELVLADSSVSRHHCVLTATNDGFVLTDLQSTHGTLVNGLRLDAPRMLTSGDLIRVGDTQLTFGWPLQP
ncbi:MULTISPECIES: adenylate/guanylate cyclase domain-containing protein [Nocardioides]|uniref:FHA domain-containing protein n=1 Tax=Nocardioides vastitatis TaxID=2568655 RepID=A0ABW0ZMW6_9ACTN|nr:adenylate/guanylate cyclase domain-containing protein [Nocardioides sp.]THJ07388.1 adenylate/guanylate cyclase domain-containing protein [Nocardioides sp.]